MTSEIDGDTLRTSDFDYALPESLIAQTPIEPRDHSRLMSLSRSDGSIRHHRFYDLPQLLRPGDLMVFNDSRVMPARLRGTRARALLAAQSSYCCYHACPPECGAPSDAPDACCAPALLFEVSGEGGGMSGEVLEIEPEGERIIRLDGEERLHDVGEVPLPPYITEDACRLRALPDHLCPRGGQRRRAHRRLALHR